MKLWKQTFKLKNGGQQYWKFIFNSGGGDDDDDDCNSYDDIVRDDGDGNYVIGFHASI